MCKRARGSFDQLPAALQISIKAAKVSANEFQKTAQQVVCGRAKTLDMPGRPVANEKDVKDVLKKVTEEVKRCTAVIKAMKLEQ